MVDSNTNNYDAEMVAKFDKLIEPKNLGWKIHTTRDVKFSFHHPRLATIKS